MTNKDQWWPPTPPPPSGKLQLGVCSLICEVTTAGMGGFFLYAFGVVGTHNVSGAALNNFFFVIFHPASFSGTLSVRLHSWMQQAALEKTSPSSSSPSVHASTLMASTPFSASLLVCCIRFCVCLSGRCVPTPSQSTTARSACRCHVIYKALWSMSIGLASYALFCQWDRPHRAVTKTFFYKCWQHWGGGRLSHKVWLAGILMAFDDQSSLCVTLVYQIYFFFVSKSPKAPFSLQRSPVDGDPSAPL